MFIRGILLLMSILKCSAMSVPLQLPSQQCITASGKIFTTGSKFTDNDCTRKCECVDGGIILCQPMCSLARVLCPKTKILSIPVDLPDAQGKLCSCPAFICEPQPEMCSDGVRMYKPGEKFIPADCSGFCSCIAGGSARSCVSLCPPEFIKCKTGEVEIQFQRKIANSNCTCPHWKCVKAKRTARDLVARIKKQQCFDGGKTYNPGDKFISADCSGSCVCGLDGGVSCASLCPPIDIRCRADEEKFPILRSIANSTCKCPEWRCAKREIKDLHPRANIDVCVDGDKHYNPGEEFISADCTARCTCISGRQVACEPVCPLVNVICKPGEIKKQWSEQIPGSKCSCPKWECVKKANEFCEFHGERHKIGEYFITKNCLGYCRCDGPKSIGCVSLCPPHGIYCIPGTRKVKTSIPVWPGRSNCACPSWKCVKVKSMWYSWSNWTECNAKCGGGIRYRFRKCMENKICIGPSIETEFCNQSPCSPSYTNAPCSVLRTNSAKGEIWPRCDGQGYFEPLQCDPSKSECWCVDKWGNVVPGSTRNSHKPQCG